MLWIITSDDTSHSELFALWDIAVESRLQSLQSLLHLENFHKMFPLLMSHDQKPEVFPLPAQHLQSRLCNEKPRRLILQQARLASGHLLRKRKAARVTPSAIPARVGR